MALCKTCGNEVRDPEHCPVCQATSDKKRVNAEAKKNEGRCSCPRCDQFLDTQNWDGIATLSCPSCRGTFFPTRHLEQVLNKLRATCDPLDMSGVLHDFKDRFMRELPKAVQYKACPVCSTIMLRRNYREVSGVVVDVCGDHGTWVDEHAFAELADFICRGGDQLAAKAAQVRARTTKGGAPADGTTPSLLGKLFGGS